MKNSLIHSSAIVESGAKLGKNVSVGPYAIIESGAQIGDNCQIQSHAIVKKHAVLGDGVEVGHFSVIGGDPQHMSFDRTVSSQAVVEDGTRIGEGVTVHRSIEKNGQTRVGESCFLMGYSHVAHDCTVGKNVVLANGVLLGGHVHIGSDSFLGGGAAVHQFIRIGQGAMVGGLAEISLDVPPQVLVAGRNVLSGLNLIGLKRRKTSALEVSELKRCFGKVFGSQNLKKAAKEMLEGCDGPASPIAQDFLAFFSSGTRGFAKYAKKKS